MTDIYLYANGELGITECVPLWTSDHSFKGSYCYDLYPTSKSEDQDFISKYYQNSSGVVDYIIFTGDEFFEENDL